MKKIMLSLAVIAIVAVGAIGATRAFFSATATVTGNTFTAGTLGLNIGDANHSWTSTGWTADSAQFASLAPGQSGDIYLAMQQTGTINSKGTISLVGTSNATNDLAQNLTFTVGFNGTTGGLNAPASYTYVDTNFNATLAGLYNAGNLTYDLGNITSSDKIAHVKIHWTVNSALTTQGESVAFNTILGLTQGHYSQADFTAFGGVNIGTNSYTANPDITTTYTSGTGTESDPVKLTLTGSAPIVTPWFQQAGWTTTNHYVAIGIKLPADFSGTSVHSADVMRYDNLGTYPNGYYTDNYGNTLLATTGAAHGYLNYEFAANSTNTKNSDGIVKLKVVWTANSAPEYFTIDVHGLTGLN